MPTETGEHRTEHLCIDAEVKEVLSKSPQTVTSRQPVYPRAHEKCSPFLAALSHQASDSHFPVMLHTRQSFS